MTRQVDVVFTVIKQERQEDGTYLETISGIIGTVSDPAGADDVLKGPTKIFATGDVAYASGTTLASIAASSFSAVETRGGV